jgi:hypothetical protein
VGLRAARHSAHHSAAMDDESETMSGISPRSTQRPHARRNGGEGTGPGEAPRSRRGGHVDLGVLPEHIGYVVRRAQLAIFKDFIQTLAPVDIRPAQYSVLIVIAENPGLTQAALGRAGARSSPRARARKARHADARSGRKAHAPGFADAGRALPRLGRARRRRIDEFSNVL